MGVESASTTTASEGSDSGAASHHPAGVHRSAVWLAMSVQLIHGDCLEVLADIPDASVDCIVIDPPYFVPAMHYNTRSATARSLGDLSILNHYFRDVFAALRKVLKPSGFMYCFCDGQSYPVFYVTAYPHFKRVRPLIWDKTVSINGYSWRHQHELILFGESDGSPSIPTGDGDILKCRAVAMGDREHLAQKPIELLERLIAKTTPIDGTVFDCFMGSGSTGIAATKLGYNFVGVEVDASYFAIAQKRIAESQMQMPLLEVAL